ncbi:MAG: tetratricopeptide repeat protein [Thermodesulfobacteriota bacterium]
MSRASRTFRIFVSSTFSDLKEERNALQREVFPKLRELCLAHGCRFQAIDLRWGIREEASLDQQTMKICLEEIARCQKITPRPNFIVLFGDRYGWRPLPYEIPANEFEQILARVPEKERRLLNKWYWRDDNAVPAVYDLQPRTGRYKEWNEWEEVEKNIRSILLRAIGDSPLSEESRSKYLASATEQEIIRGALNVEDAHEHVFCFFRKLKKLPKDYSAADFIDLDENGKPDKEAAKLLADLEKRLKTAVPNNIFEYEAEWGRIGPKARYIKRLCVDVLDSLTRVIKAEIDQLEETDPLEQEIADHEAFGKERSKFFVGRAAILQTIAQYIDGGGPHPLVIYGESGSGKTALMAKAVEQAQERHKEAQVIFRYIGATPGSSDGRSLIESICQQIYDRFNFEDQKKQLLAEIRGFGEEESKKRQQIEEDYSTPTDYQKLSSTFRDFLAKIRTEARLILFLDALDQMSEADHARNLGWLPSKLPDNVRLIVSTLPGDCFSILERTLPKENLMQIQPMASQEGSQLLELCLADNSVSRTLQAHQRAEVLAKFEGCGLPLYLKLAFEEARRWKSYGKVTELSPNIPGTIRDLFSRLSSNANHGKILVSTALGYLAAAKNGLTEDEMLDVLSVDEEVLTDFIQRSFHEPPEKRLPAVVWSRLYFDLEPYLTERSADETSLMGFYHRQFADVVTKKFLTRNVKRERHKSLAAYFEAQDLQLGHDGKRSPNVRKVSELPYQQTCGALWDDLEQTLCDLRFIEAKCASLMVPDLALDYRRALGALPECLAAQEAERRRNDRLTSFASKVASFARGKVPVLQPLASVGPWTSERILHERQMVIRSPSRAAQIEAYSQFIDSQRDVLGKYGALPGFCVQHAFNCAATGPLGTEASASLEAAPEGLVRMLSPFNRTSFKPYPALLMALDLARFCPSFKVREAFDISPDCATVVVAAENRLEIWDIRLHEIVQILECSSSVLDFDALWHTGLVVIGTWGGFVELWDMNSGRQLDTYWVGSSVHSMLVSPGGDMMIAGNEDGEVIFWNLQQGSCLRRRKSHAGGVTALAQSLDGRRVVSAGADKSLRIWDLGELECRYVLVGHADWISSLSISMDGKLAISGSRDKTVRIWDLEERVCIQTLEGHSGPVRSVDMTPDGKLAISSAHEVIRVWDLGCGKYIREYSNPGYDDWGMILVRISWDGTRAFSFHPLRGKLRIWDVERGGTDARSVQTPPRINCVAVSPDRNTIAAGREDATIELREVGDGNAIGDPLINPGPVRSILFHPHGRMLLAGCSNASLVWWDWKRGKDIAASRGVEDSDEIPTLIITRDGKRAVSASRANSDAFLWDTEIGTPIGTLKGHRRGITVLHAMPDGRRVISGGCDSDCTSRLWDIETETCVRTLVGHSQKTYHDLTDVVALPQGRVVLSAAVEEKVRVWDSETGECVAVLEGHTSSVNCLCVTPDGKRAISGGNDGTLRVWDLSQYNCLWTFFGHSDSVHSVKATLDGNRVVSASYSDNTIRVWDLLDGRCVAVYPAPVDITCLSEITSTGRIACGTASGDVIILECPNLMKSPPLVTPARIWLFGQGGAPGKWDDCFRVRCPWCGGRFEVPPEMLELIRALRGQPLVTCEGLSTYKLDNHLPDNPVLTSDCPLCSGKLKYNPFVFDAGYKPVLKEADLEVARRLRRQSGSYWQSASWPNFDALESMNRDALAIQEELLPPDHPDLGISLNSLAFALRMKGEYKEAEPIYRRALSINETHYGSGHRETALSHMGLARSLYKNGEYGGSVNHYISAIRFFERSEDSAYVWTMISELADILQREQRFSDAEVLLRRAIELPRLEVDETYTSMERLLRQLGEVLELKGEYQKAEEVYRQALSPGQIHLTESHSQNALSKGNLIRLLITEGKVEEAEGVCAAVIEEYPGEIFDEIDKLNELADEAQKSGNQQETGRCLREIIELHEKMEPEQLPGMVPYLKSLAGLLIERKDDAEAQALLTRALKLSKQTSTHGDQDLLEILTELASLESRRGKTNQAEALYWEAVEVCQATVGSDHEWTGSILTDLGILLLNRRDFQGAEECLRKALAIYVETCPLHGDTARASMALGSALEGKGNYHEAERAMRYALTIYSKSLDPHDDRLYELLTNLLKVLLKQGTLREAEPIASRLLEISARRFGRDDERAVRLQSILDKVRDK